MKILYLASVDPHRHRGAINKIKNTVSIWNELGAETEICFVVIDKDHVKEMKEPNVFYRGSMIKIPRGLMSFINGFSPDIIYLRSEILKPYLYTLMSRYKIVLELNTDEQGEYRRNARLNLGDFARYLLYLLTRNTLYKKAAGIVCVTHEIAKLSYIKRNDNILISPNSVDLKQFKILKRESQPGSVNVLFLGDLFQTWSGLDKIIQLAKYGKDRIRLHMVGNSPDNLDGYDNFTLYENRIKSVIDIL